MKSVAVTLGIFFLMAQSLPSTSIAEPEPEPQHVVPYNFVRLAPSIGYPVSYSNMYDNYNDADSLFSIKNYRRLIEKIEYLRKEVAGLKRAKPACPPTAPPGSTTIGPICYNVVSTPATFEDALKYCRKTGGTLVEPYPQFTEALYPALKHAFYKQFKEIERHGKDKLWIGAEAKKHSIQYKWISTGTEVTPTPNWKPPILSAVYKSQGALLNKPGMTWTHADKDHLYPFVCWSTSLAQLY